MSSTYDKRTAAEEFTRWSRSYDRSILQRLLFGPSHRALLNRIRQRHAEQPLRILDVGCGTGLFAARVRAERPNAEIWGVDLTAGMLTKGRDRWEALADCAHPVQGDSERLPFASRSFDVITCANSFHHYPRQDVALGEMLRVLKPGGRVLLIDGYRDAPWGWFIYDVCVTSVEGNVLHCSRRRFRELFDAAGFASVEQKVFRGAAPFVLNEAVAPTAPAIPAPHFEVAPARARAGASR